MEAQQQINFAEVKATLNALQAYILAKQALNNNQVEQPETVSQEMNLAPQSETQTDHLVAESVLSSEGINADANEVEVPAVEEETTVLDAPEMIPQGVADVSTEVYSEVSEAPEIIPQEQPMTVEPAVDGIGIQFEQPSMLDTSASGLMNDDASLPSEQLAEEQNTDAVGIIEGEEPAFVPSDLTTEPEAVEATTETSLIQPDGGLSEANSAEQFDTPVPEFTIPQDGLTEGMEQPQAYIASGNAASTVINDITPAVSTDPVVMPTGTTPDMGNNPDLVVSAESFGPTL